MRCLRVDSVLGIAILCGVMGACGASAQQAGDRTAAVVLRDGVVLDPDTSSLAVMRPGGGIDALEAMTGKVLWTSGEADRPLLADGDQLLAQIASGGAELGVAILDMAANGKTLARGTLRLPDGVIASIDDGLEHHFEVRATATPDGVLLAWEDRRAPMAAMPALQRRLEVRQGAARVDLDTGTIASIDPGAGRALMTPSPPNLPAGQGPFAPTKTGVMFRGAGGAAVMVSVRVSDKREWDNYLWSLRDLRSGEALGEVRSHQSYAPFTVLGGVLLYEVQPYGRHADGIDEDVPLSVAAVELKTGALLWRHPVRDTKYRGPLPD